MTIPEPPGGQSLPGDPWGSPPTWPPGQQYGQQYPAPGQPGYGAAATETCAFHSGRPTALHCTRCGRPACPECLTPASVGFHCRACVAESRANQRVARTVTGARAGQQPMVTFVLIGINMLVFLITAIQARSGVDLIPSRIFRDGTLAPTLVASGQWWRLLTSGFLHLSVIHIGLNMLSLYFVGVGLERILGRSRFLAVYLLALLGGSASVMLFTDPLSSAVGASGAIFGILGGLVVVFKRFRYDMRQLIFVLAINLYLSFQIQGISWQAHVGGLVVGAAVTAAMVYPAQAIRKKVQIGAVVLVLVLVAASVVISDTRISGGQCDITATGYFVGCADG